MEAEVCYLSSTTVWELEDKPNDISLNLVTS
jgi:hypothetical protein